jgi:hypothetical protein
LITAEPHRLRTFKRSYLAAEDALAQWLEECARSGMTAKGHGQAFCEAEGNDR